MYSLSKTLLSYRGMKIISEQELEHRILRGLMRELYHIDIILISKLRNLIGVELQFFDSKLFNLYIPIPDSLLCLFQTKRVLF